MTIPRRQPAAPASTGPGLRLSAHPAWTALAHPALWAPVVDGSGRWHLLPRLLRLAHRPGVAGVGIAPGADGRPVASTREAVEDHRRRGYVEVPPVGVHAHGRDLDDYCVGHRTATGAVAYLWAWERPEVSLGRSVTRVDRDAQVSFLRYVAADLLGQPECPQELALAHRDAMGQRALRLAVEAPSRAVVAQQLEHLSQQLRSLGWGAGLPLTPLRQSAPLPVVAQPTEADDLRAELAALRAQIAAATAAPPAASALVGSARPEEVALDDDDAPHRAPARIPRRPTGAA